jgi:hypothetical protein
MFCPFRFNEAISTILEQNDQKDSLKLGRGHILREVAAARRIWVSELASTLPQNRQRREDKWHTLVQDLERVFAIEKNRLLGFPDKRGVRRQSPVYCKRAELQRHLRASQALIVTAGTGCGKCARKNVEFCE